MANIRFEVTGDGQFYIEKNRSPYGIASPGVSFTGEYHNGDQLGMIATAYRGASFINICDVPQTECITTPSSVYDILDETVLPQKMIANFTNEPTPPPPTTGFTITADKTSAASSFITRLKIDYPSKPGETVSILAKGIIFTGNCVVNDIILDSMGHAEVDYQVTDSHAIQGLHGLGCCSVVGPQCTVSNVVNFQIGIQWQTWAFAGIFGLAALFILTRNR